MGPPSVGARAESTMSPVTVDGVTDASAFESIVLPIDVIPERMSAVTRPVDTHVFIPSSSELSLRTLRKGARPS